MALPDDLSARGWIIRQPAAGEDSLPLYVRGVRREGDGYCETKKGFVYAYSVEEAREYDTQHKIEKDGYTHG